MKENNLTITHPELCKQWHPTLNGKLSPEDFTAGSSKRIVWLLPYDDEKTGHHDFVWASTISNRTHGYGCPYLAPNPRAFAGFNDLGTLRPDIAREWHPYKNGNLKASDVTCKSNKRVWWLLPYDDPRTGKHFDFEWDERINARVNNNLGCPYLTNHRVCPGFNDLGTLRPDIAKEWHPYKNGHLKASDVPCNYSKKVWWFLEMVDEKNGKVYQFEWENSPNNRMKGEKCPYLSGKKIYSGFNDFASMYPNLAKEWHPTLNGNLKPSDFTQMSGRKVWWLLNYYDERTQKHFEFVWEASIANRVKGRGCPYLENRKVWAGFNDLATLRPDIAQEWHLSKNKISPTDVVCGSTKKAFWICTEGHTWQATIYDRTTKNTGCPYCTGSNLEKFTYKILKDNNFEFIAEKKFQNPQVKFFPYDIYICGYNLLIEIDGKQHFEKIDYFEQGNYTFEKRVNRDNLKNNFAFINDIPILRIPYIYYAPQNRGQIERIIKEFISTRKVPDDILDYYKKLRFSNYYEIGHRLNEFQGGYNLMTNPC